MWALLDWLERHFVKVWVAWVFVVLAFWVGVLYVAVHFIRKWW